MLLFGVSAAYAVFGRLPDGRLDQKALRAAYMESEFVKVAAALESFRKANPPTATKMDSVFTYKYLGVIYAADSNQITRAEQNFNQLLALAPNIELVDMYVPAKIQAIFNEVKTDYLKRRDYESKFDPLGNPINRPSSDTVRPAAIKPRSSRKWLWWSAAGLMVGTGVGYLIWAEYLQDREPKVTKVE